MCNHQYELGLCRLFLVYPKLIQDQIICYIACFFVFLCELCILKIRMVHVIYTKQVRFRYEFMYVCVLFRCCQSHLVSCVAYTLDAHVYYILFVGARWHGSPVRNGPELRREVLLKCCKNYLDVCILRGRRRRKLSCCLSKCTDNCYSEYFSIQLCNIIFSRQFLTA